METLALTLLSGAVGALLAIAAQVLLARRVERQQSDRELIKTVLEFTGRSVPARS
jgi:ABC-type phosphate/phosphonate transport system permease subunit